MTGTEHRDPPSANQDAVTSTRAHLKALPQRLMPRVDAALDRRWARGLLVVAFVVPLAFLLGPSFSQRPGDVASHLKVGARAETNIKATRDFDYQPGLERLEEQRREAAKAVLPVFDYHTDQGAILLSRVSDAFRTMAGAFAAAQKKEGGTPAVKGGVKDARGRATQGKLPHALATGGKLPRGKTSKRPSASSAKPGAPGAVLEDPKTVDDDALRKRFSNLLQSDVSDDVFRCLRKARFSADVRAAIVVLVASAMDQMVVSHRGVLSPFAGKPVTVRRLVGGRPGTRGDEKLASFNVIKDLLQIKEQVRHQANVHGSKLDPKLRGAVVALVDGLVVPNLIFDPAETTRRKEAAQDQIRPRSLHFVKGQVLIRDGDPITKKNARIVAAMARTYEGVSAIQVIFGVGLFALVLLVTVYRFASDQFERFSVSPRDLLMMGTLLVGMLALTRGVSGLVGAKHLGLTTYLLPVAGGAMLVRLLVSAEAAAFFAVVVAGLVGLSMDRSLELTFFYLVTGLVASFGVLRVQSRSTLLRAGLMAGLAGAATVFSLQLFGGQLVVKTLILSSLAAVAGGLLVAFAVLALLPAIEWLFAYTTDISLLELANLNHPLLRELMLRAPGTYHHSMVVGNLAEAGCEAIGANGLRARVAAYYHDVGKMKNAAYFAENFHSGDNPHSRLKASMSALIIRSHIKDGIEMMREHGIPEPIIETASQHHGTALISFFYHKAIEQKDEEEEVLEADYRYPGPKPQSREAGVIMVADGVEAAARSLGEPSDDRLQAVAQRIINTQFTDGQLDQCDLTLRDLHMIAKSFLQVLSGIYHARPTYPWQRRDDTRGRKRETLRHKGLDRGDVTPSDAEGAAKTGGEDRNGKKDTGPKAAVRRSAKGQGAGAGPKARDRGALKDGKGALKDGKGAKDETDVKERQLARDRTGEGAGGSADAPALEEESSPDIKRLGLN